MAAIQIYKYENGRYTFDISAFKEILNSSGDNLVAVYSMNGPLRLGKSFMLGFFLRYLQNKGNGDWISMDLQNKFQFKGGSDRDTTGIWMWSEPYVIEKNGQKISILLMDTQGCFDQETTMQDNALVFALSALLSSVMIFNINKQISEDNLQFLQYFAGFARLADNDQFDEPFQRLIFLIRDWQFTNFPLGYYDDNTSIDGKNYKKTALDVREDQPQQVKYVHGSILNTFEDVSFYLMPHPGKEVAVKSIFNIEKVDEDFVEHVRQFVPLVLENSKIIPKKIGGQYLTGNQFIIYVEKWAEIFEGEVLPGEKTIFEATAEIQSQMAMSAAIDNYSQNMKQKLYVSEGMAENVLKSYHLELMEECVQLFKSYRRLGEPNIEVKYLSLISEQMSNSFEIFNYMNTIKNKDKQIILKYQNERTRIENEITENERKLNAISTENKEEREKMLKILEENKEQMKMVEKIAENEMKRREKEMAQLQQTLKEKYRQDFFQLATVTGLIVYLALSRPTARDIASSIFLRPLR